MRRVLITGSRKWTNKTAVYNALQEQLDNYGEITVVHGACPTGADKLASDFCSAHHDSVYEEAHPADWDTHGRAAGPIRNTEMVKSQCDICLAFMLPNSRGTQDCASKANAANIELHIYSDGV